MGTTAAFQTALAFMCAEFVEWLKRTNSVPWITEHTAWTNRIVAALVAMLSAIGITSGFVIDSTSGYATLTLGHIPATWETFSNMVVIAFEQFWIQKGYWRVAIVGSDKDASLHSSKSTTESGERG